MNFTAEVNATIGDLTEIIRINASKEFIVKLNEGVLSNAAGGKIVITGVFRLFNEEGTPMDVSD